MNPFVSFFLKLLIVTPTAGTVWLVNFVAFDQSFLMSSVNATLSAIITYWLSSIYLKRKFLKLHRLSGKEYAYIRKNLKEAKPKLFRLQKSLLRIRHIPSLKQRIELIRVTKKIYSLTKREPKRFYKAERFYFSHLDSAVELAEKYVFLAAQPKKNLELDHSLNESRRLLDQLSKSIEEDLYQVLSDDIDQLNFEIDVAKFSIKNKKDSKINEESWRLK
jgi:5-bromo-4-chloroindolyl phosphate hydrolysis protein